MRRGLRTSVLMVIPFVLLLNSDHVVVTTTLYGDMSGIRRVRATGDSALKREIARWTRDMTRGYCWDALRVTGDSVVASRSTQRNEFGSSEDIDASALDVVQKPLSLTTEYRWNETIEVDFLGNDKEQAAAPLTDFEYRVTLPGRIVSAQPAAEESGRTATWTLSAEQARHEVSVTARSWRWDVIVLLVYIAGYLAFRITSFLVHRARLRPRKI